MCRLVLKTQGHIDCNEVLRNFNDAVIKLVSADRSSLFLLDSEGTNLHAQVFGVSKVEEEFVKMDHVKRTCFGDDLEQLGCNVVSYKEHNIV